MATVKESMEEQALCQTEAGQTHEHHTKEAERKNRKWDQAT